MQFTANTALIPRANAFLDALSGAVATLLHISDVKFTRYKFCLMREVVFLSPLTAVQPYSHEQRL